MSELNPGEEPRGYREKVKPRSERRRELRGGNAPKEKDSSRRRFLRNLGIGTLALVGFGAAVKLGLDKITELSALEESEVKTLKEKILSFDWEMSQKPEKLRVFTEALADAYLELTPSTRMAKTDLVGPDKTNFYKTTESFAEAVQRVFPEHDVPPGIELYGYANYPTKQVFVDLAAIKRTDPSLNQRAGLLLANTLFHEWGYLDLEERTKGEYLNFPRVFTYQTLNGRKAEEFEIKKYHGGMILVKETDTIGPFFRFAEVWNETLAVRRVYEALGRDQTIELEYGGIYYSNGLDIFLPLTMDIPLQTLYEMHATSDFEGFAKLIGRKLPGDQTDFQKGIDLMHAISIGDPSIMQKTGIFSVISLPQR